MWYVALFSYLKVFFRMTRNRAPHLRYPVSVDVLYCTIEIFARWPKYFSHKHPFMINIRLEIVV